ncbi:MAG: HIT domain-containing protein [Bacilli bacterium]|nr:HIT domain-containing protein [Bacilli bacterium]
MKFDKNCIFCKLANKIIPSTMLYEDDDVVAFLDVNPVSYGHTLVVTKAHYDNFLSCPKNIMHKVYDLAQRIGQVQIKQLGAKGVNILANCYEAAGQSVMHFHVHVIPRYDAPDGLRLEFNKIDDINLPALAEEIKTNLD